MDYLIEKKDSSEAGESLRIYKIHLDNRKQVMKSTQFKVEEVFGSLNMSNEGTEVEQINKFIAS